MSEIYNRTSGEVKAILYSPVYALVSIRIAAKSPTKEIKKKQKRINYLDLKRILCKLNDSSQLYKFISSILMSEA